MQLTIDYLKPTPEKLPENQILYVTYNRIVNSKTKLCGWSSSSDAFSKTGSSGCFLRNPQLTGKPTRIN